MEGPVRRKAVTAVLGLIVAFTIYALSVGPVFAFYVNNWPIPMVLLRTYRPLFHFIAETTSRYIELWGYRISRPTS